MSAPGTSGYNNIYIENTPNNWVAGPAGWLRNIGVAGNGTLGGTNPYNSAYLLPAGATSWIGIATPSSASMVAPVNSTQAYVLGTNGQVYFYSTSTGSTLISAPSGVTFKEIAAQQGMFSYNTVLVPEVYALDTNGNIYNQACAVVSSPSGVCTQQGAWTNWRGCPYRRRSRF